MPGTRGGRMGQGQVNPAVIGILGAIGVVALIAVVYFALIKPGRDAAAAQKDWVSPEAAAARAPGGKPKDASHEAFLDELRAKEHGGAAPTTAPPAGRSRRRDE